HQGPYPELGRTYGQLHDWIHAQGEEDGPGPWESYLDDPEEVTDSATLRTEVLWRVVERGARGEGPADRHRPSRRARVSPGAHPGELRPGHRAGRRLHRARSRLDEGRRARRAPRERDRRHDRCRRAC